VFANTRNTRINGKNGNNKGVFAALKIVAQQCSPGLWPGVRCVRAIACPGTIPPSGRAGGYDNVIAPPAEPRAFITS
jgi:hypothetical protein